MSLVVSEIFTDRQKKPSKRVWNTNIVSMIIIMIGLIYLNLFSMSTISEKYDKFEDNLLHQHYKKNGFGSL